MQTITLPSTPSRETPWGYADTIKPVAPGLWFMSTPSHGGYKISTEMLELMPAELRSIEPWAGHGWYEEDCDWAIIAAAWPTLFPADHVKIAISTLNTLSYAAEGWAAYKATPAGQALIQTAKDNTGKE